MLLNKVLIMLAAFLLLSSIGFGPSLMLTSSRYRRRLLISLALSPVVGTIAVAFPLYSLFVIGVPVGLSIFPVTLAAIVLSLGLLVLDWRSRPLDYRCMLDGISRWKLLAVIATWISAFVFLLMPVGVGGEAFQYYQTNTDDATNYVLMATFARNFPAHYVGDSSHYDEIIQRSPLVSTVMSQLANSRPSVSHLLVWQSVLFNQTPLSLYHFAKLLSILMTAAVTAALGYQFGLRLWQQLGLMFVSSIGFWAIYILDSDALSQLYAVPLSLLLIFAFVQYEAENRTRLFSRHRWFLALGIAGLLCFYPEMSLLFLPTLGLYYGLGFLLNPSRSALKVIGLHALTIFLVVLLLNVIIPSMLSFSLFQSQFAVNTEIKIDPTGFFHWLFYDHNAWAGSIWGLYYFAPFEKGSLLAEAPKAVLIVVMFCIMAAIVGAGILKSLTTRLIRPESRLIALLIAVYWGGGISFYLVGNDWVGGKTIAMGAPFMVLGVFVFLRDNFFQPALLNRLFQVGVMVWIITQILVLPIQVFAPIKPVTVTLSQPAFPDSILPVADRLRHENPQQIGLDLSFPKPPLVSTFALALTDIAPVYFSDGILTHYSYRRVNYSEKEYWMTTDTAPDHLVVADTRDYLKPLGLGQSLIEVPAEILDEVRIPPQPVQSFAAYAVKPGDYDQALYRADILNPDVPAAPIVRGMDAIFLPENGQQFVRWMTGDSSELHFISGSSQPLGMVMEASSTYDGNMTLDFNDTQVGQFTVKKSEQKQSNSICLTARSGSNVLKLTHKDDIATDINRVLLSKLLFVPVDTLDVGALGDTRQIETGWESQENWGGETIRWAAQDARIQIMTCAGAGQQIFHFRAFLPAEAGSQTVTINLNGSEVGTIDLKSGWNEYQVTIPGNVLQTTGLKTIDLHHSHIFIPTNDTRSLAAAYDHFWFANN